MARQNPANSLETLRFQWEIFLFAGLVIILAAAWVTRQGTISTLWLFLSLLIFLFQSIIFYFDLEQHQTKSSKKLIVKFGVGTWLSLTRLLLLSLLSGFLVTPTFSGWFAWAPFYLYLTFNLIDLLDGFAARFWGQETLLGAKLDLDLDGRGMLIGSLMAVLYGTAGWWYLLVGLVRYLYVIGIWARKRQGLPVIEKANPRGRPLAGLQMGVTTALLAPVLHPPFTILISTIVMIPFLGNFLYDWLVIGQKEYPRQNFLPNWAVTIAPVFFRVGVFVFTLTQILANEIHEPVRTIAILSAFGILLGIGVRVLGLVMLVVIGLGFETRQPGIAAILLSLFSLALVYLGPGIWARWQPENPIIRARLGEKTVR